MNVDTDLGVTNRDFLKAIFGEQYIYSHVTSFTCDPNNIPVSESARCWAGGAFKDTVLIPNSNQFYTVSLFSPDEAGKYRRRKANFSACHVVGLDDVREKLPIDQVERLPPPSIVIKSSLHSEQWLYLLDTPETEIARIDNLHDGLIKNGLAPNAKDPGQKGVTRYLRLPEGCNTKEKRIAENAGIAPRCVVTEWHPERRYTLQQLAVPFSVNLDAPRTDKRIDGALSIPEHPLLHTDAIKVKEERSNGRFDITCPWVDGHTAVDDSGSAMFTNSDGSIGFKCHHGSCDSRNGSDLLKVIEKKDVGFNEKLKQWQLFRGFPAVSGIPMSESTTDSPRKKLLATAANGKSSKMRKQMMTDKFILKDLAILGQWTVFYAGPNTGKTLLTLWLLCESISSGEINGKDVIYANCDDTYKGGVEKLEIAEQNSFHMMIPNQSNFKLGSLLATMEEMVEKGEATGMVIVLDTLKKFTDLMDKKTSSQFGNVARAFVSAGGTLICLAHVNKHKGADGKSIHTGTADIKDDSDCVYTIETLSQNTGFCNTTTTIKFENSKNRGNVADSVAFQFTKTKGAGYFDLFESICRVSKEDSESVQKTELNQKQRVNDAEIIEQIKTAITNGETGKRAIENFVSSTSKTSRNSTTRVLELYAGQLWLVEKGMHNKSTYRINEAPRPPVSFM